MKVILIAGGIIALTALIISLLKKNKNKSAEELSDPIHDSWVSSKKASDRISAEGKDVVNQKFASGKMEIPESKKSEKLMGIINDGNKALSEMNRLSATIQNESVKNKILQISQITTEIMKDAIDDPDDIYQIKRFFSYYLPTTIKLLYSYEKLEKKNIDSDNIVKAKANIEQMLDVAIDAYSKRLDSLFENQSIDIETDIDVMNQLLEQEGLINKNTNKVQVMEGTK